MFHTSIHDGWSFVWEAKWRRDWILGPRWQCRPNWQVWRAADIALITFTGDVEDYKISPDSNYTSRETYQKLCNSKNPTDLTLLHMNTRSLPKYQHKIEELLLNCAKTPELIVVSETNIQQVLENYDFLHADSKNNTGGVGLFIRVRCLPRNELTTNQPGCVNLWVELRQWLQNNWWIFKFEILFNHLL